MGRSNDDSESAGPFPAPSPKLRGLILRHEEPADAIGIRIVNERAFGRENEARLVEALRCSSSFLPDLSIVAVLDDLVVGHALFTVVPVEGPEHLTKMLALAPVAVLPDFQKQGVGAAMIVYGLTRARATGHRAVVVVGHPAYYPRFGFKPARPQGLEALFPVPDDVFMAMPLVDDGLQGVRGVVRYPPAFDDV